YFINNVPPGTYTLRGQLIGYQPTDLVGVRVLGGQTLTQNFLMKLAVVTVTGINIVAAVNPLVPRDETATKSIINGDQVANLPIDNVRNAIALTPGVVESGNGTGLSIRGGRPGEANVYIDGAPVRSSGMNGQGLSVQTNAVEEASVTTGALPVQFGDAQSGVISLTTRSGGENLRGSVSALTDGLQSGTFSNGFNRFEGSLGGPVPGLTNLRFFVSGVAQGQTSCGTTQGSLSDGIQCLGRPYGAGDVPNYDVAGVDTVVTVNPGAGLGSQRVAIPRFVQYGGQCDPSQNSGFSCQGTRLPDDWSTTLNLQGKMTYFYGSGSSVALSGVANTQQNRNYPGTNIVDPLVYSGQRAWQRSVNLNWTHQVFKSTDRALSFNVIGSFGTNQAITGILDPTSEAGTRNPMGGFEFSPLTFGGYGSFLDEFFNDPDQIVKNLRTNSGDRTPLLGQTQFSSVQSGRVNPYGMASGNFFNAGLGNGGSVPEQLYKESRAYGSVNVDWQANQYHRFTLGGELRLNDVAFWTGGLLNQIFMNAYHDKPTNGALWASDRLDLGDVVIDLGMRYDYFHCNCLFSNTPAFTFNDPGWSPLAATNPASYDSSVARVFSPGAIHSTLSPRIGVSFPITDQTDFHLSYSHQVQSPDINTLLAGINNDLSFTNANQAFGRDVGFGKTIQFEFGVRHAFNPDLVLDLSAYNKSKVSDQSFRIFNFSDPTNCSVVNGQQVCRQLTINVLTSGDFGYDRGIDMKLDRRVGSWLSVTAAYTYEVAAGTGSSPFSYLSTNARSISGVTGSVLPPAEQARAVNDQRTHNLVGAVSFNVPQGWQQGTTVGSIFKNVSAFVTFRVLSGLPYTPILNTGAGQTAPGTNFGLVASAAGDVNSATTPWTKYLDLRVNKVLKVGGLDLTAFADIRNLFNWKNITGLFAETNDVTNGLFETTQVSGEFPVLASEAANNGALRADGAVLLNSCATWAGASGPVDCVELRRAEARFGNGDGVYTVAEQGTALHSFYNLFNGAYTFNDAPRDIRLGFELNF
ncbi:MAG TPA: TonB-dependent receptor, partial [Gemmatimonadales bacterium]|nr:TonB-dependent receptor [Gemmatimonadales bacterium]